MAAGNPILCRAIFDLPLEYDQANADCLVPGKDGQTVSRKGAVVDRRGFEGLKDEYYRLRGWEAATGRQTREALERVGLADVANDLQDRGLLPEPDSQRTGGEK